MLVLVLVEAQVVPLEKKQVEFMKNKCSEKLGRGDRVCFSYASQARTEEG